MTVVVTQFGFSTGGGNLANVVDFDLNTFWRPLADGLDAYPIPPVADSGLVIPGYPRPAIQFDFNDQVRVPMFQVKVETPAALGRCWLIASDNEATSVDNTIFDANDINAGGYYTVEQMNAGIALFTNARFNPIRKRFWRFVFWQQPPAA
jgi:hypothetical protein